MNVKQPQRTRPYPYKDLTGKTFNKLTVLERSWDVSSNRHQWRCRCECGNIITVPTCNLRPTTKSCGCLRKSNRFGYKHGLGAKSRDEYCPQYSMWAHAKRRAKKKNLPFTITVHDIVVPATCPLLGTTLKTTEGPHTPNSPSLDRLIPELGYVQGNVWVISNRANTIKNNASLQELHSLTSNLRLRLAQYDIEAMKFTPRK